MKRLIVLALLWVLPLIGSDGSIQKIVEDALVQYEVPGAAVGIVHKGSVIFAKGVGYRNIKSSAEVTKETLFPIGSLTKAFTTFAFGQLVAEGKLHWDDKVTAFIPEFALWDKEVTSQVTIRDLLAHRTGLPFHDAIWLNSKPGWGNSEFYSSGFLHRLQYLDPVVGFREKFIYNNLMYGVAGVVVEKVRGKSWEKTICEKIFKPLGMTQSNFSVADAVQTGNMAMPHVELRGKVVKVPLIDISICGAAGAINSSLSDMVKWIQCLMGQGKGLIEEPMMKEIYSIQIECSFEEGGYEDLGYGLGWYIGKFAGEKMLHHEGQIDGFRSMIALFPESDLGIVVLSNSSIPDSDFVTHVVLSLFHRVILDKDYCGIKKKERKERAVVEDPGFVCSLEPYFGTYEHPGYGAMHLFEYHGNLVVKYYRAATLLKPLRKDFFVGASPEAALIYQRSFEFIRNEGGQIVELRVLLEPKLDPIIFKRLKK